METFTFHTHFLIPMLGWVDMGARVNFFFYSTLLPDRTQDLHMMAWAKVEPAVQYATTAPGETSSSCDLPNGVDLHGFPQILVATVLDQLCL